MDGFITGTPKLRGMIARMQGRSRGMQSRAMERSGGSTLRSSLVSWWPLTEGIGTRFDLVGSNHWTDKNNPGPYNGVNGPATQFVRASAQYLSVASNPSVQFMGWPEWEMSAWLYAGSVASMYAAAKYQGPAREFLLWNNGGTLFFYVGDGITTETGLNGGAIAVGSWQFVTVGVQGPTMFTTRNSAEQSRQNIGFLPGSSANTLYLGSLNTGNGFWDGAIASVGLWRRVLSRRERVKLFNGGLGFSPL